MEEIIKEYILALLEQRKVDVNLEHFNYELAIYCEPTEFAKNEEKKRRTELDLIQKTKNFIIEKI